MLTVNNLRTSFIDFFRERGHKIVPSSPLLPKDDPTLLFTTAGMVQFKPMFAGTVALEYARAASIQKCLRTSDLEQVGKTKRHLTFFEMLGNFSFGDYFKDDAIRFAWDYSTGVIGFPRDEIWVSIFENDDEAFAIWNKKIGVPADKIVRLGKKDNFWGPAGDSGACGPCSELYIDRGPAFGCGSPDCKPGCDCERFLEYWNLVFNQFNQDTEGNLSPLPRTGIDTGMGLERLATLVQKVDSVYETDEFVKLIDYIARESGIKADNKNRNAMNIMAEHARALTFAMVDGIYPSNDGRGYVLRRILRRALRFGRQIGIHKPFLFTLVDPVTALMKVFYPELGDAVKNVKSVIESEEKRFLETLENGMDRLEETMKAVKKGNGKEIPGKDVFILYDTFGFPAEMTLEIAQENGLGVNMAEYESEMTVQRERGKQSWKGADADMERSFGEIANAAGDTVFTGYDESESKSAVAVIFSGGKKVKKLKQGERGLLSLNKTCFYGEAGGQVGDIGDIVSAGGARFAVRDAKKFNKTIIHVGEMISGDLSEGEEVTSRYDGVNRNCIRANHTATHLLQASLRRILGNHVKQAGSLVSPERLRFDFSHFSALTEDELKQVEETVNGKIWENLTVTTEVKNIDEAITGGAMAVFDEKYEDTVRVVSAGDFSKELCGGTHVANTGAIGVFKITREGSPGAGLRRIEALTLKSAYERMKEQDAILSGITGSLNVTEDGIIKKIQDVIDRNKALEKEREKRNKESLSSGIDEIIAGAKTMGGVKVIMRKFENVDAGQLREISDAIRSREQNSLALLGSSHEGKALILYAATNSAVSKGIDCGRLIKETAPLVGGGGGGRKDMAQAGGKTAGGLDKALEKAEKMAAEALSR